MTITLREAVESDAPLLFQLYAGTRQAEMSQVPWTDAQKQAFLEMQFAAQTESYRKARPDATREIVCAGERAVGQLCLDRQPDRLHIVDLTLAPEFQNQGIGSEVLRRILEEADRDGKRVTIYVESFNRSLRLFERLGFRTASVDGFYLLLERPLMHL